MLPCKSSHKVIISEDKAALLCSNTSSFKIAAAITIAVGAATAGFATSIAAAAAVGTLSLLLNQFTLYKGSVEDSC